MYELPTKSEGEHLLHLVSSVIKELREIRKKKWRTAKLNNEKGKVGWIILWALGIPIPILLVLYFLRGCT